MMLIESEFSTVCETRTQNSKLKSEKDNNSRALGLSEKQMMMSNLFSNTKDKRGNPNFFCNPFSETLKVQVMSNFYSIT